MNLEAAGARLAALSKRPLRAYATRDFGREQNPAARSVVVTEQVAAKLVPQLRVELGPDWLVFIGCTRSLATPTDHGSEVVIAPGNDQFEILRIAQSDAINYGLETEDLIRKLQDYHAEFGIDIFHAETDTIEFKFLNLPDDMLAYCEDLYEFCPDIVDQGTETIDKLAQEIVHTGTVYLWWD